jgi:hypothetical protein
MEHIDLSADVFKMVSRMLMPAVVVVHVMQAAYSVWGTSVRRRGGLLSTSHVSPPYSGASIWAQWPDLT